MSKTLYVEYREFRKGGVDPYFAPWRGWTMIPTGKAGLALASATTINERGLLFRIQSPKK